MELLLAILIFGFAVGGLAAGLLLGRGPIRTSCAGIVCLESATCAGCPHRRPMSGEGEI